MTIVDPGQTTPPPPEEPTGVQVPVEPEVTPPPPPKGSGPEATTTPGKADNNHSTKTFTAEDIEKARKEEKDKLYKSIEDMKGQLAAITQEKAEREKAAKEAEKQAAQAAKAKAEEELSAKELLAKKEAEWEER